VIPQRLTAFSGASLRAIIPFIAGLFCFGASLFKTGPSIFGDELGYLSSAREVAVRETIFLGGGTTYHPGIGVLYAIPALLSTPQAAYLGALAVNALLVGLGVKLVLSLAEMIPLPNASASTAAGMMIFFPFVSYYSSFAMSETLVMTTGILITWLCSRLDSASMVGWDTALLGIVLGGSWLIHPRFVVAPLVVIPASLFVSRKTKQTLVLVISSGASFLLARFLVSALTEEIYDSRPDILTRRINGFWRADFLLWLSRLGGTSAYVMVSTAGIIGFGLVALWQMKKKWPLMFCSAVGIPVAVLGLSTVGQRTNAQYLVYGRYVEPLLFPALFLGLVLIIDTIKTRRAFFFIGAVSFVGSLFLLFRLESFRVAYPIFNSPGLILYTNLFSRSAVPYVLMIASLFIGVAGFFRNYMGKLVFSIILGTLLLSTGSALRHSYELDDMAPRHARFERDVVKSGALEDKPGVWIDRSASQPWGHIFGTQWAFSGHGANWYQNGQIPEDSTESGNRVIIHAGQLPSGFDLVAVDKWTRFVAGRPSASPQFVFSHPRQTPKTALRSRILHVLSESNGVLRGNLTVTHTGDAAWFPRGGAFGAEGAIRFVIRWKTELGETGSKRLELPSMVFPGESVDLPFEIDLGRDEITQLTVEGVHEGVRWFSDAGGRIHVLVGERRL